MLRGPGGVSGCCGKAGQLVESGWQRGGEGGGGRLVVRRAEAGALPRGGGGGVDGDDDDGEWTSVAGA